jgi:hypothetical protein
MFKVHLTWTQAAPMDAYRIYKYETGEGPAAHGDPAGRNERRHLA